MHIANKVILAVLFVMTGGITLVYVVAKVRGSKNKLASKRCDSINSQIESMFHMCF